MHDLLGLGPEFAKMAAMEPRAQIEHVVKNLFGDDEKFDSQLLQKEIRVISAEKLPGNRAKARFEFTVTRYWTNGPGSLHGAAQSLLYDTLTSSVMQLVARPGFWQYYGVSRTLNVTYLRPGLVDEDVVIDVEILNVGQKLAALRGEMRRKKDGSLISVCEHNKVNTDPPVDSKL